MQDLVIQLPLLVGIAFANENERTSTFVHHHIGFSLIAGHSIWVTTCFLAIEEHGLTFAVVFFSSGVWLTEFEGQCRNTDVVA